LYGFVVNFSINYFDYLGYGTSHTDGGGFVIPGSAGVGNCISSCIPGRENDDVPGGPQPPKDVYDDAKKKNREENKGRPPKLTKTLKKDTVLAQRKWLFKKFKDAGCVQVPEESECQKGMYLVHGIEGCRISYGSPDFHVEGVTFHGKKKTYFGRPGQNKPCEYGNTVSGISSDDLEGSSLFYFCCPCSKKKK